MCSSASSPTNRVVAKDKTAATSTRIDLLNQIKAQRDLTLTDFKEADRDVQKRTSEFLQEEERGPAPKGVLAQVVRTHKTSETIHQG